MIILRAAAKVSHPYAVRSEYISLIEKSRISVLFRYSILKSSRSFISQKKSNIFSKSDAV